ncbi:helix-turn-helix domain-containing protein [Haloimpatiens massiliensis]|uniref:helix-turn-helix domain-containing protein n=1 Tax=Haloimpatiens massiliensis TaxID=1658110 RepID=UPI000C86602A|nr:helix-turn-helix domain-containing protein [Haloimpatiens massiliensis]
MRREYVNYMTELPIAISMINIIQYPIHWHDSIEILFVLKGSISVTIETEKYEVEEGEIEIINCDEAHSIKAIQEENKVLLFHLDPNFFEKYFNDIRNIFFYTNSSEEGAQEEEKYYILRRYLSILVCEAIQKVDKYEDNIEENLVELLYHLINNFHQLMYERETLKDNDEQFKRYDRIVRYIYSNYKDKISLQEIAKKEFLSSDYLSHEIKNTVGYSFKDFLNLTRVEESIKLLLDTDMTVSEISEELGFSHIRYFNKHFKKHYNCTPLQYRKKYKVDDEKLEDLKMTNVLDIKESLEYVSVYLEDYDRYNYENKIVKIGINPLAEKEEFQHNFRETISIGEAKELLKESGRSFVAELQKNIEFSYAIIYDVFSDHMGVGICNEDFFNWNEVKEVINFLLSIKLRPFIVIDNKIRIDKLKIILESFVSYFREEYGDYELLKWKVNISQELSKENSKVVEEALNGYLNIEEYYVPKLNRDLIYDTCYMIPYIIENSVEGNNLYFKAFDCMVSGEHITNELFLGDYGLVNQHGMKKPSYYAYYFLSKLGDTLIDKGDGYIVTKQGDDIQILLCSYGDEITQLIMFENMLKKRGIKKTAERKFSLNIVNLSYDYNIIKYEINEKQGSTYNYWINMGKPKRLKEEEVELLKNTSFPKISFGFAKRSMVYNIVSKIHGYGATLIVLKKVQKHLY